jgi:hypothetical protein
MRGEDLGAGWEKEAKNPACLYDYEGGGGCYILSLTQAMSTTASPKI